MDRTYEVTLELTFDAKAPNTTEAKARLSQDMQIHKLLKDAGRKSGLVYRRRGVVRCKRKEG